MSLVRFAPEVETPPCHTSNMGTLDTAFADPDMEAMRQKLNEMILNGRR
jgi:hypothetical protein